MKNSPILLAIILLGFTLRIYKLGDSSLWYDETVSAFLARQSVPDLIAHTARDIHPPGYYLLLHFWTGLVGQTEFALAYCSLIFGLLLIPLIYALALRACTPNKPIAIWAALLTACSPFGVWYSQEVRMYTLGAVLGLMVVYSLLKANQQSRFWFGYWLCATLGLYILYYFAFLLIVLNLFLFIWANRRMGEMANGRIEEMANRRTGEQADSHPRTLAPSKPRNLATSQSRILATVNSFVLLGYLPWLPIAWQQITSPPVPPWRSLEHGAWGTAALECWTALSVGQSVEPTTVWFILLITFILFVKGWQYLSSTEFLSGNLLLTYTFAPILLINLLSLITPLYHVRYIFIYSPPFYIFLGAGLATLRPWLRYICLSLLLGSCLFSIEQMHTNPRYRSDDYRAAVNFIEQHWQPDDALMVNAGYVYPAFLYYARFPQLERARLLPYKNAVSDVPLLLQTGTVDGSPQLGWGNSAADFYGMDSNETLIALNHLSQDFPRLWLLRAYDTVTDPNGLIRTWLANHAIPLEDQVFSGESNIRAQGFLLNSNSLSVFETMSGFQNKSVYFADGLLLKAWYLPAQNWSAGQTVQIKLWWQATASPKVDYKISLKLWKPTGELAAQGQDSWAGGTLYRSTAWRIGTAVYQPAALTLPPDLSPGQYWLNVELYHPDTIAPLGRLDGTAPVVTLGVVEVKPR